MLEVLKALLQIVIANDLFVSSKTDLEVVYLLLAKDLHQGVVSHRTVLPLKVLQDARSILLFADPIIIKQLSFHRCQFGLQAGQILVVFRLVEILLGCDRKLLNSFLTELVDGLVNLTNSFFIYFLEFHRHHHTVVALGLFQ